MLEIPNNEVNCGLSPKQTTYSIVCRGKLPNSSYYDVIKANEQVSSSQVDLYSVDQMTPSITTSNVTDHFQVENNHNNVIMPAQEDNDDVNSDDISLPLTNSKTEILSCVFSSDNSHLVWSCGYGIIKIMRWSDSKLRKRTRSEVDASSSPNSSPSRSSALHLNSIDEIAEIDCGEMVTALAFCDVDRDRAAKRRSQVYTRFNLTKYKLLFAVGLVTGRIRIYDAITGKFLFVLFDHNDFITSMMFSRDCNMQLASTSRDGTIKLWDMMEDGNMYKTLHNPTGSVNSCDWSPVAPLLCTVGINRAAIIWNLKTYNIKFTLQGHLHDIVSCQFSPDGAILATASFDTKIILWDPYTGKAIKILYHLLPPPRFIYAGGYNGSFVRTLVFSRYGDHLISLCDDKKIRIWSTCTRQASPIAEGVHNDGLCCAYSTRTRAIMIGTRHSQVDVFEAPLIMQRLKHLCRVVVNKSLTDRSCIKKLDLPVELKHYLAYDDIRDKNV